MTTRLSRARDTSSAVAQVDPRSAHPPPRARATRVWPSLTALLALQALTIVIATAGTAAAAWLDLAPGEKLSWKAVEDWATHFGASARGYYAVVFPVHLATLVLAIAAGLLSSEPLGTRLGWSRPRVGAGFVALLVVGTAGVQILAAVAADVLFGGPNAQFLTMSRVFRGTTGWDAAAVGVGATAGAAIAQEVFFRGYVLRGLLRRWSPTVAVAIAGIGFAVHHGTPYYAAIALPPGLWLGVVAWRTGSVVPPIVCHALVNAAFLAWLRVARPELDGRLIDWSGSWWLAPMGAAAFIVSLLALHAGPHPRLHARGEPP